MNAALTEGQRLAQEAAKAAEIRDWQDHPDVVALRVEKVRARIDRMMWAGIILGLLFTMVNVQQFAARTDHVGPGSLGWWSAWVLDPTMSLILLGVLIAERHVAPGQIKLGTWSRAAKWSLLAGIYVMNTWESWTARNIAGVILHSIPPLVVFVGAEAVIDCHDKLTAYVQWAHTAAKQRGEQKALTEEPLPGRDDRTGRDRPTQEVPPTPDQTATVPPYPTVVAQPARPASGTSPKPVGHLTQARRRTTPVQATDVLLSRARAVRDRYLSQGKTAGHVVLRRELNVPERVARELAKRLDEQPLHVVGSRKP